MHHILSGPNDWRGAALRERADWVHHFSAAEIDEVYQGLGHYKSSGKTLATMEKEDFPLPRLTGVLRRGLDVLESGPGLFLLRGFPVEPYDKAELRAIYWALGKHLGTAVSQSKNGDILGDVRNLNIDMNGPNGRGYTSNQKLTYHTDSCDVVGLFVLRTAKSGGMSIITSSVAIHDEIARTRPDLLEVLYQPFHWSWQGQEAPGTPPHYRQPIFTRQGDAFSCRYVRTHILSAQRFDDVPRLTPLQQEALALLDELAGSERFHFTMMFQPGDIQFLNNHVCLHSRTAFEDHEDEDRRRHLLRMWLSVPNSRALSPSLATIFQDQRAGAVRGGFPSRTGQIVYQTAGGIE